MSKRFQGWRRPKGSHAIFTKVHGAVAESITACTQKLMELCELRSSGLENAWEYEITEGEQEPQTYGHRMMRSR
jgi:hypothetical protein